MALVDSKLDHLLCLTAETAPLQSGRASIIPFGAILSPEPLPGSKLPSHDGSPLTCIHCEAFACSLAKINSATNEWTCPFCGNANPPNTIVAELGESMDFIEHIKPEEEAGTIHADTAPPSTEMVRIIAVDLASSPEHLDRIKAAVSQALDATPDHTQIALLAFGSVASACRLSSSIGGTAAAAHFDVLVPSTTSARDATTLKRGRRKQAESFNNVATTTPTTTSAATKAHHVAPLAQCREQVRCAVDSLRYQNLHRPVASLQEQYHSPGYQQQLGLQRMQALIEASAWLVHNNNSSSNVNNNNTIRNGAAPPEKQGMNRGTSDTADERLGNTIAAQLIIVSAAPPLGTSSSSFLSTSNSFNDDSEGGREAAEEYMNQIAMYAVDSGIVVDVLALAEAAGGPTTSSGGGFGFGALASSTGGLVLPHAAIGSAMAANLQETLIRGIGSACTIEIRCSIGLKVVTALGPVAPLTAAGKLVAKDYSEPVPSRLTSNRNTWVFLSNPPDMHQSVSILLETTSAAAAQRHLYLQTAVAWTTTQTESERVVKLMKKHRIITKRLTAPLTVQQGGKDDASGVDWGITSVFFAKQVVAEALDGDAAHNRIHSEIIRRGLSAAMKELAELFGTADESSRGWFSGPSRFALPKGSLPVAQVAFFLHRAVLQPSQLGDVDAREMLMGLLASAPFDISKRMCRPELHVLLPSARAGIEYGLAGPALELQPVPAVDLALLLSTAAVLDVGNIVYLWLSRGTEGQQRVVSAAMELAQRTACSRSPQADVLVVAQGSPQQRQVMARLTPIAADPIELQIKQLPLLSGFTKEQIEAAVEEAAAEGGGKAMSSLTLTEWLREQDVLLPV